MTPGGNPDFDLIVIGGGPAGMMAGLLFARAGCKVRVLEKHADFFRDFRGDTVHPSTMEILDQLGMLQRFLKRAHNRISTAELRLAGRDWAIGDLSHLETPAPFIAMMPQWDFLDFIRDEAKAFAGFHLEMNAPVTGFIEEQGRVVGVRLEGSRELRSCLVIAADGRDSLVRKLLAVQTLGAPMDVLWFRISKQKGVEVSGLRGNVERGRILVMIDRGDYWQCAFVIPKGKANELKAGGIGPIRDAVHEAAPDLDLSELKTVDDLKLLSVALDRLKCWWMNGLLAIGDAAHTMSPIGGIGINLAVQDAVAAANLLARPLAHGDDVDRLLNKVQDRRLLPTRIIQAAQRLAQDRVIGRLLQPGGPIGRAPLLVRLLDRYPLLRRIPGRLIGLGVRRERVRSPEAPIRA
jgi:2-polyprenyl-6-methoxyphenol hydroxylase-like FAD-dependent oxidoreductase